MFKICKIIILLFFFSFPLSVNAHVQHYEDLNRIEFDIYRNNKHIGTHIFSFKKSEGQLAKGGRAGHAHGMSAVKKAIKKISSPPGVFKPKGVKKNYK